MKSGYRRFWVAAFTALLFVSYATLAHAVLPARVISVCILNDKAYPASEELIRKVTTSVFREYEAKTGIRFEARTFASFDGGSTAEMPLVWFFARVACPASDEVRVLFTNQTMVGRDEEGYEVDFLGRSNEDLGVAVIYDVGNREFSRDQGGNPALETSLKHELAHLFKLKHTPDRNSFMYSPSNDSYGMWTDDILKQLRENIAKKWR